MDKTQLRAVISRAVNKAKEAANVTKDILGLNLSYYEEIYRPPRIHVHKASKKQRGRR